MVQSGHDDGLPLHVLQDVGIFNVLEREDLHGHLGPEDLVTGQLHFAGGTLTKLERHQLVVSYFSNFLLLLLSGMAYCQGCFFDIFSANLTRDLPKF